MKTPTKTTTPSSSYLDPKTLCLQLAYADKESEVIDLLKQHGLWDDQDAWQNYGGKENNFSDIGNQMACADTALVEKLINSGDAMLLMKCAQTKLDPESPSAPESITEGLKKYFGIPNGKLSALDSGTRANLAENIGLVASGDKRNPSYAVFDKGIGQSPSTFPDTFLSLTESNKMRIHFVQGRFNMGSTGVLQFCGKNNLQLIISRRHPDARKGLKDGDLWGFTVVRRQNPRGQMKSSVFTYLAPKGDILSFSEKSLPILPSKYPQASGSPFEYGSYVKMYEYDIGAGLRTNILFDLYNRLSLLVPGIALPVRMYERRTGYIGHSFESNLGGLATRLEDDKLKNLETGFPADAHINVAGHKMDVKIYAFKRGAREKYAKSDGVIFSLHGQMHGSLSNDFFGRNSVGMSYLKKDLLVLVDCSEIDGRSREDLFMNSRDRLRAGNLKAEIEKNLTSIIQGHQGLRALREQRKKDALANKLDDSKPIADVLAKVLKNSPVLSSLLGAGVRISDPFLVKGTANKKEFKGKRFPTYFTANKEYPQSKAKECHEKSRFRVSYETDADNDYFTRDNDPGTFQLLINGQPTKDYTDNLWNGHLNLSVALPKSAKIGDVFEFKVIVDDSSRINAIEHVFWATKVAPQAPGGGAGKRKNPSSKKNGGKNKGPRQLDIPPIAAVSKEGWDERGFDKNSALQVIYAGKGNEYDFFYNADNIYLKSEQKGAPDEDAEIIETQYKSALVLMGLAMLREEKEKSKGSKKSPDDENDVSIDDEIFQVTSALSPVLLPIIRSLGGITHDD